MRENKFRAYCHRRKEMSSIFELGEFPVWVTQARPYWDDTWEFMQYLGFQDKDKVDIFDGDVVAIFEEQVSGGFALPQEPKEIRRDVATVERFPGFWLRDEKEVVLPKNTLVLGNIYQHPELVEVLTN